MGTLLLLLKSLLELTISLTLCTPREHLSTGTLVKEWKKVSFPKLVKIWLHWRKIMKKSVLIQLRKKEMREKMMINSFSFFDLAVFPSRVLLTIICHNTFNNVVAQSSYNHHYTSCLFFYCTLSLSGLFIITINHITVKLLLNKYYKHFKV